jgi:hypothetical protein
MAFVDMARSHVERMLREGFELERVVTDGDGDWPFRHRSAAYWLTLSPTGHLVRAWSRVVEGVKPTAGLLREVNDANSRLLHSRAYVERGVVWLEAVLPVQPLEADYLAAVCSEIGCTADALGPLLAAVHGGWVPCLDEDVEEDAG